MSKSSEAAFREAWHRTICSVRVPFEECHSCTTSPDVTAEWWGGEWEMWQAAMEHAAGACEGWAATHDSMAESAREIGNKDSLVVHANHANGCRECAAKLRGRDE